MSGGEAGAATMSAGTRGALSNIDRLVHEVDERTERALGDMHRFGLTRSAFTVAADTAARLVGLRDASKLPMHLVRTMVGAVRAQPLRADSGFVRMVEWADGDGVLIILRSHQDEAPDFEHFDDTSKALESFTSAVREGLELGLPSLVWSAYPDPGRIAFSERQARRALRDSGVSIADRVRLLTCAHDDQKYVRVSFT
jgi:hypothetical protein